MRFVGKGVLAGYPRCFEWVGGGEGGEGVVGHFRCWERHQMEALNDPHRPPPHTHTICMTNRHRSKAACA